jgi:hypothetical protein
MLREVGLRPTRQLGARLHAFGRGDRHVTAEMLYEEACKAKVAVLLGNRLVLIAPKNSTLDNVPIEFESI